MASRCPRRWTRRASTSPTGRDRLPGLRTCSAVPRARALPSAAERLGLPALRVCPAGPLSTYPTHIEVNTMSDNLSRSTTCRIRMPNEFLAAVDEYAATHGLA